jgi:hypothetical protein
MLALLIGWSVASVVLALTLGLTASRIKRLL